MLKVECEEHFRNVCETAKRLGLEKDLQESLDWLADYACHGDEGKTRCRLFKDFAPLSFTFLMEQRQPDGSYKVWFNGGLIYEGPDVPANGSAPSFTVSLNAKHGWSIHT